MDIRQQYVKLLNKLEEISPIRYYDSGQLDSMARGSKLSKKWNTCDSWDLFVPDSKKPSRGHLDFEGWEPKANNCLFFTLMITHRFLLIAP